MDNDKIAFFEKYKEYADASVLEQIWQAKIENWAEINLNLAEISDLSPLKELKKARDNFCIRF